jgi:hypothetical protein
MKNFTRRTNIILSIAGLAVVSGLLIYYLLHDELWKKEVHIGFAGLFILLVWRLVKSIQQDTMQDND